MSEHNCDHVHPEDAPMRFAKYGNFVVGSAGLAVGAFTGSSAVLADAVHNFSDAFAHNGHIDATEVERHGGSADKLAKTRKRAALLFGGGAVVVGAYSGIQFYKGGAGFYNAGELSAKGISDDQHHKMAEETFQTALTAATSGKYDLVICDEINNAVHDGLLDKQKMIELIEDRNPKTSLCLTGRNFPEELLEYADIASSMTKLKHHFDDKFLANSGIDF